MKTTIAYKGFDGDFSWKGFQYKEKETYKVDGNGMMFSAYENLIEMFLHHDKPNSRFAEVELWGNVVRNEDKGIVFATNIKIVKELSLKELTSLMIDFIFKNKTENEEDSNGCFYSSYICDHITTKIRNISSSGFCSNISTGEPNATIVTNGNFSRIALSGANVRVLSNGYGDSIATVGSAARIFSNGNKAKINTSGHCSEITSNGYGSVIICSGSGSIVKAKKGSWITLTEYSCDDNGDESMATIKTEYVDGKRIKEDTWYKLKNGEFVEVC